MKTLSSIEFIGKTLEVGDFIYSYHHKANVEVFGLYEDETRNPTSIHRKRISVAGVDDSVNGRTFSRFNPTTETIFHEENGCTVTEVGRELITDKNFIKYHS